MAKLGISTGTVPNDNTGDSLITGAIKINKNFDEIYTYLGAGSTNILSTPIWIKSDVGISTLRNVGIGTTNPTSTLTVSGNAVITGVITAATFSGSISNANYSISAGIATYSSFSGVSTFSSKVSVAETTAGTNSILLSTGTNLGYNTLYIDSGLSYNATTNTLFASTFAGNATYSSIAGIATYATLSGISSYTNVAGISTYATLSGVSSYTESAGIATIALGLSGGPNLFVGVVTATSFFGDGSGLTGIVGNGSGIVILDDGSNIGTAGTINFGDNLTVSAISAGVVTVTASAAGISSYTDVAGISTYTSEWFLGANGTSDYTFTGPGLSGVENDPTLYLIRGQQYKFTNQMGQHPFRIQSTPNGSVGTQYNNGIDNNDVSNGTLTWDVQFDSPNTLYYQCTTHPDMGGVINILNVGVGGGESYWASTAAGIHTSSNVGIGTTNPRTPLQIENIYGVKTGLGTFSASVGVTTTIDTLSTEFLTAEYTLYFQYNGNIQSQKVLVMNNGVSAYSQEYAIMFEQNQIVSVGATIFGPNTLLQVTPETGISGVTTYRFTRQTMR